jgi:penicillin-binding protein 1A
MDGTDQAARAARTRRRPRVWPLALAALGIAGACAVGFAVWTIATLPPLPGGEPPGPPAVLLLTSQGEPFARRGVRRDPPVDAATLPPHVTEAFVAIEDRRFYDHPGVDLQGVLRAAFANLQAGEVVQGGSTITQQLVKNTMFGPEQTLRRKLQESIAALWLERRLTKTQILSDYLNTVYFGEGAYGLGAASRIYFGKDPSRLTTAEAAMLAGLVKAPSQLAPRGHLKAARARARVVIAAMVQAGYLTPEEAARLRPARPVERERIGAFGGYFADWLYPQLAATLTPQYGEVTVRTTLDGDLQRRAEAVVRRALSSQGRARRAGQAALVAMRPDGAVVAMVGGRDHGSSPFNRAVQARRQPGSAFKLFVYLAAFRNGAHPDSLVSDAPIRIGTWTPANADGRSHGVMTLEDAFAESNNLAAIRISEQVGRDEVIRAARDLGVTSPLASTPSLPLGTSGVSLLELTSAYAAVAAGAYPVEPTGLALQDAAASAVRPMDEAQVRQPMLQLLQAAAERGTGRAAALPIPVFGKTGTTQDYRDALFVGFSGGLVTGVWVGNDDDSPMNRVSGGSMPAAIWRDFMQTALADQISAALAPPPEDFGPPEPAPRRHGLIDRLRDFFAGFI